jgi:Rha family phage regulatory protein
VQYKVAKNGTSQKGERMNELTIINQNGQLLVDSRDVADMVGKNHAHLLRDIKGYIDILTNPNLDSLDSTNGNFRSLDFYIPEKYIDSKGETRPCYLITRKGCDMVANKLTGEKGVLFTAAYVTRFEKMEKALILQHTDSYMIEDPIERAKAWIKEQEKKKLLEAKIAQDKPKVLFADSVTAASTSILVGDLAKLIKQNGIDVGEIRLWKWLRNNGYAIKEEGHSYNMPTQKSMNLKVMEVKEGTRINSLGESKITKTTLITGKGQVYFVNKFLASKSDGKED